MFKHGFPPEWSTLKKLIWLVGSGIAGAASGIWKTVTGTLIHITDALASPMQKCEVSLEPIQDLHGQDAPYPAGGGKNKCNAQNPIVLSDAGNIGNQPCVIPAGSYVYSATTSAQAAFQFSIYNSNGDRLVNLPSPTGVTGRHSIAFTISEDAAYLRCYYNAATTISDIQVEAGSTATPYKPFANICPITGWTGCEVTRTGANLFDKDNVNKINAYVDNTIVSSSGQRTIYIPCKPNTTYTAQKIAVAATYYDRFTFAYTKTTPANGVAVYGKKEKSSGFVIGEKVSLTLTTGEDAQYLVLWVSQSEGYNASLPTTMIEEGSTASNYAPYSGTTLSVTFPDTVYGGSHEFVSGGLTSEWATATFDGSNDENWSLWGGAFVTYGTTPNIANSDTVSQTNIIVMADRFKAGGVNYRGAQGQGEIIKVVDNNSYIAVDPTNFADVNEFKAYLANNPMQIIYKLATPTEISLTPQEISTLRGENNVWGSGDIELTYKAQA